MTVDRGQLVRRRRDDSEPRATRPVGQRDQDHPVIALQRAAGNAATALALARQPTIEAPPNAPAHVEPPATPATFKVLIVDDGKSGLDQKVLDGAKQQVEAELGKIAGGSQNALVKAGFKVEYVSAAPEWGQGLGRRDLDVTTFVVFLTKKGDVKRVLDLAYHYLDLDARKRDQYEKKVKSDMATEGGHNMQTRSDRRGHPSESISFVGTDAPLKLEKQATFGPDSAAALLGDVILHELGHAMGHVHDDDAGSEDHSEGGIMSPAQIIGSSGPYQPGSFSRGSAEVIRKRLEWLAGRIAARAPKSP